MKRQDTQPAPGPEQSVDVLEKRFEHLEFPVHDDSQGHEYTGRRMNFLPVQRFSGDRTANDFGQLATRGDPAVFAAGHDVAGDPTRPAFLAVCGKNIS